jgi:hypothetical protein
MGWLPLAAVCRAATGEIFAPARSWPHPKMAPTHGPDGRNSLDENHHMRLLADTGSRPWAANCRLNSLRKPVSMLA